MSFCCQKLEAVIRSDRDVSFAAVGSACEQLFNVAPPPETKHFAEIYEKMLQHEHHRDKHGNVRTVYAGHGFYLDIIAARELATCRIYAV